MQTPLASDWDYSGEGGKNVVFSYVRSWEESGCNRKFVGKLLRVAKSDLFAAFGRTREAQKEVLTSSASSLQPVNGPPCCHDGAATHKDEMWYVREVVAPLLTPYVDIPETILLDDMFLSELYSRIMKDIDQIPLSRRKNWQLITSKKFQSKSNPQEGTTSHLMTDYRVSFVDEIHQRNPEVHECIVLACEIKPKAGYLAFSPLVERQHRAKYSRSRFALLQDLHQRGYVDKAWTASQQTTKSDYDPIDLFSNDPKRIHKALERLMDCPQNNLRVWKNMELIIGYGLTNAQRIAPRAQHFRQTFPGAQVSHENSKRDCDHVVVELLACVLKQTSVLQAILDVQTMDVLDADGAVLVFEHLVSLCSGDKHEAMSLIDCYPKKKQTCALNKEGFLRPSPFQVPQQNFNLKRLISLITDFRTKHTEASCDIDWYRSSAIGIVEELSREECCYLLSSWLLALTMCDVSLFVTLQPSQSTSSIPLDSDQSTGELTLTKACAHFNLWEYSIKIIDCDAKPSTKLLGRRKKEQVFSHLTLDQT